MTLERKAQLRRTELRRRTPMPRQKRTQRPTRPRDTGPSKSTKDALWQRAGGVCELQGCSLTGPAGYSRHHRRPRGMGGTTRADSNGLANLLLVCGSGTTGCHGLIEAQRSMSIGYGWLVRQDDDPATVPAMVRGSLRWLTPDGDYATRPVKA